jgi:hypothetical protein
MFMVVAGVLKSVSVPLILEISSPFRTSPNLTMLQLLGITWTSNNYYFRYLIWLTGGIPRCVSYLNSNREKEVRNASWNTTG